MIQSLQRIYGLYLRQFYIMRGVLPRVLGLIFWPTFQILIWGFLNKFLSEHYQLVNFTFSTLLGATLFSAFLERSNVQVMWTFLEDIWARNVGNVMISPVRSLELVASFIINGVLTASLGVGVAAIASYLIFDYSIFVFGLKLIPLLLNLTIFSWSVGILLICMLLKYGSSGEYFAWMIAFIILPFVAVYYPVSVLPSAIQPISWLLPPTYVFESIREIIRDQTFNMDYFLRGLGLNLVYLALVIVTFVHQLKKARQRGGLLSMSE